MHKIPNFMVNISILHLWRKNKKDNILILHENDESFFYPLTPMEDENGSDIFQSAISVTPEYPKFLNQ